MTRTLCRTPNNKLDSLAIIIFVIIHIRLDRAALRPIHPPQNLTDHKALGRTKAQSFMAFHKLASIFSCFPRITQVWTDCDMRASVPFTCRTRSEFGFVDLERAFDNVVGVVTVVFVWLEGCAAVGMVSVECREKLMGRRGVGPTVRGDWC